MQLPYDPAIALLGLYSRKTKKSRPHKNLYTIAHRLFIIAQNWKPKCPSLNNSPLPQPLATTVLLSVYFLNLTTLSTLYDVLKVPSCCSIFQNFLPFKGWIIHYFINGHWVASTLILLSTWLHWPGNFEDIPQESEF